MESQHGIGMYLASFILVRKKQIKKRSKKQVQCKKKQDAGQVQEPVPSCDLSWGNASPQLPN